MFAEMWTDFEGFFQCSSVATSFITADLVAHMSVGSPGCLPILRFDRFAGFTKQEARLYAGGQLSRN